MPQIAYYRVSTKGQQTSGLGLAAQRSTVHDHLKGAALLAEYQEAESGKRTDRPELKKALDHCRRTNSSLIVAKVDRLARNARFLLTLIDSGVEITFCDLPTVTGPAGKMLLVLMAGFAEMESALISERTKKALCECKKRGVKLGGPNGAAPLNKWIAENGNGRATAAVKRNADCRAEAWRSTIVDMVANGLSNNAIARALTAAGGKSVKGGAWTSKGVSRLRCRLALA